MIMKANKQIGFIYKNNESIDKILKDGDVVFERGFLREKTSTTLPITFGGVSKNLKDYRVYGNTYQKSISGKNLYTINSMKSKSDTVIIDGETLNISYDNTNGSSTKYNEFHTTLSSLIKENEAYSIVCEILEISGTGTLRLNSPNNNVNESQFTLGSSYSISDLIQGQILIENVTALNSFENATRCVRSNIRVGVGQSCNAKLRISLIKGTVNPNDFVYEPYTGGQPSPNPDYPQEIVSCGDRTGNLFDTADMIYGSWTGSSGGVSVANYAARTQNLPASSLAVSVNSDTIPYSYSIIWLDSNDTFISRDHIGSKSQIPLPQTFSPPNNAVHFYMQISCGSTQSDVMTKAILDSYKIMLNTGSTALPYEPYGYKIPVNVRSDNLFDKDNANILNASFSYDDKKVNSSQNGRTLYIKCKPNTTYTVTKKARERFRLLTTETLPSINVVGNNYQFGDTNSVLTIKTTSNDNYLCVYYYLYGTDTLTEQQILDSIMIVEGSTAPSKYIPYYNQTTNIYLDEPLRKIGDYADYIDFINGKVVRNIKEHIFNGSDNDRIAFYADNNNTLATNLLPNNIDASILKPIPAPQKPIFCNKFSYIGDIVDKEHIYLTNGDLIDTTKRKSNIRLYINKSRLNGYSSSMTNSQKANLVKTWLSNNPIIVDYILQTPTEESITLPNIPTVDGNNTLNIDTELTPSQVYIKYKSNV